MRFLLLDQITQLTPSRRIRGRTMVASSNHPSGQVPAVLLIEAMAQAVGWLIVHAHQFERMPILSLLQGVRIEQPTALCGRAVIVDGELRSTSASDSLGSARLTVEGNPLASIERIIYTHVPVHRPDKLRQRFDILARGAVLDEVVP